MAATCVAILSPGDMGHAVGALLAERGFRLVSALGERSELTRARAARAGIEDAGDLEGAVREAEGVVVHQRVGHLVPNQATLSVERHFQFFDDTLSLAVKGGPRFVWRRAN